MSKTMILFHNPRCMKSREALGLLNENGKQPEIREYLKEVPTEQEILDLLQLLNMEAKDLIRKNEKIYKEEFRGKNLSNEDWIKVMLQNPKLIERPIFINNGKAVVGRPPEKILELL